MNIRTYEIERKSFMPGIFALRYFSDSKGRKAGCVLGIYDEELGPIYGVARCKLKCDNFSKVVARELALQRAYSWAEKNNRENPAYYRNIETWVWNNVKNPNDKENILNSYEFVKRNLHKILTKRGIVQKAIDNILNPYQSPDDVDMEPEERHQIESDRRAQDLFCFDNTQAYTEGWVLFNDGEIQMLDESPIFETDIEALNHVIECAKYGSQYHIKALDIHNSANKTDRF